MSGVIVLSKNISGRASVVSSESIVLHARFNASCVVLARVIEYAPQAVLLCSLCFLLLLHMSIEVKVLEHIDGEAIFQAERDRTYVLVRRWLRSTARQRVFNSSTSSTSWSCRSSVSVPRRTAALESMVL